MRFQKILAAILLVFLAIGSAGCVSFGSQTTDIMMEAEKVVLLLPENAGTPSDPEEFFNSLLHMPLSNSNNKTLDEALASADAAETINQSVSTLENVISGIFGT